MFTGQQLFKGTPPLFFDQKLDFELSIRDDSPKCYLQLETSLDLKELTSVELLGSQNPILAGSLYKFFSFFECSEKWQFSGPAQLTTPL